MKSYYEVKLIESFTDDKGKQKSASRRYILGINEGTMTNADEYIYQEIGSKISKIQSIREINPDKILNLTDSRDELSYYSCKVLYLEENDNTGKIKRVTRTSYVLATDITEVKEMMTKELKSCIDEYVITAVNKTNIQEILIEK